MNAPLIYKSLETHESWV